MSERLDKLKLSKGKRWERLDPIENQQVSTYDLIRDAIKEDKMDLAADLTKYLWFWEMKFAKDSHIDLVDGIPSYILNHYGEDAFIKEYEWMMEASQVITPELDENGNLIEKDPNISNVEWAMDYGARMVRGHRMGKEDGWGGFVIEDYPDRIEILWDPCYTGGRTRRGDPISGQKAHSQWPYNYQCTCLSHKWTGGYNNVSPYCVHCFLMHELGDTDCNKGGYFLKKGGYFQQWNVGYDPDDWKPCRYIAYKNIDWIPESYYERIGRKKPPLLTNEPKPENCDKLIRSIHSDELGERYINTARRLWETINKGDKEKALELVDYLNAETVEWSMGYPYKWNWTWIDRIVQKYGYTELYSALRTIPSAMFPPLAPTEKVPTKAELPSAEERVREMCLWGRSDRCGPDCSSVKVTEEEDRYVIEFLPCGGCGRNIMDNTDIETEERKKVREDLKTQMYQSTASLLDPPYNFGVTTERAPINWGKLGIPNLCTACCSRFDLASVSRSGYLEVINDREEGSSPNCRWLVYKDVDNIPEEYYTRIGCKKPPVTAE